MFGSPKSTLFWLCRSGVNSYRISSTGAGVSFCRRTQEPGSALEELSIFQSLKFRFLLEGRSHIEGSVLTGSPN